MTTNTAALTDSLADIVANSYRLLFKIQSFHWNAKGPLFASFHALTQTQYEDLFLAIDALAERIRALGEDAPSSLDEVMNRSEIRDRLDVPPIEEMIRELVADHKTLSKKLAEGVALATKHDDHATADMLTARIHLHDKNAWLLQAML